MPFTLIARKEIPEIASTASLYRHDGTGARLLSLANADENKVFGISFRTPPSASDGVAHIMEHSVLCGSERYPVKEPFVELLKGSLNTFLNAMTYPDKTVYPVASANLQDFRNLVEVYMDAVLHPLITEDTFHQEGWHLEVDPESGELSYKGVVYNEMKGAYSDPDDMHSDYSRRALFPDTPYGFDSGGDPAAIPTLDYAAFKAFHDTYYHPSNAFIYFYGDDDPEERLAIMDRWLEPYDRRDVDSMPALQPGFTAPRRVEYSYDSGDGEKAGHWISVNWGLTGHGDPVRSIGLSVLSNILTGTSASPLRKALIESGLGEDLSGFGFTEEMRTSAYSIGLKGVAAENLDAAEHLVIDTLRDLSERGIDPETVAASVNTVEFALRERNTGRYPRGLALMFDALNEWLYENDPLKGLAFAEPFAEVKRLAARGGYFEGLIREWLLENPHRVTVVLKPDPVEGARRDAAERDALAAIASSLSDRERADIAEAARRLKELQETPDSPEALATIPTLKLSDLPKSPQPLPAEILELDGRPLHYHELPTAAILYLDLAFDMKNLPARLLPYAGLLGRAMLEMGAGGEDFVRIAQRIGKDTGGIRTANFTASRFGSAESVAKLFVRSKALAEKAEILTDLLVTVLASPTLDNRERFRQIVLEEKAQSEASIIPSGHRLVGLRMRSRLTESDWAAERIGGYERLRFLRSLAERVDSDWPSVLADLRAAHAALLDPSTLVFNVTADAASFGAARGTLESFVARLSSALNRARSETESHPESGEPWPLSARAAIDSAAAREALVAPSQVNFVGKALRLRRDPGDLPERSGAWMVAGKYLDTTYLWEKVRVQGGAYGGFSSFDINSGVFMFVSYRDPNVAPTFAVFDRAAEFLGTIELHPDELRKSIIGAIGDMDAYLLPDAKGFTALIQALTGYTPEIRQRVRDGILGASARDFSALGDSIAASENGAVRAALGREEGLREALPAETSLTTKVL